MIIIVVDDDKISDSLLYLSCISNSFKISNQLSFLYAFMACTLLVGLAINILIANTVIFIHILIKDLAACSIQTLLVTRTDFGV